MRNTVVRQGRRALMALSLLTAMGVAAAPANASACSQPLASQPYLTSGDFNYYIAAPRPGAPGFDGSTWTLSGGAKIVTAHLGGGKTLRFLDLPAGSSATSPDMCVTSQNPVARVMVRSPSGDGGPQVGVSYAGTPTWTKPQPAGQVKVKSTTWTLSNTLNLQPPKAPPPPPGQPPSAGWQVMRMTFTGGSKGSDDQIFGLHVATPPPAPSTGPCSQPPLSQAFLPAGDTRFYTPAPGQNGGGFIGTGWTLRKGARVVSARRADGTIGKLLLLPAGSTAVSPNICVTSLYPTARMMIRSPSGAGDVSFRVSYANTKTWTDPHETGHVHGNGMGWSLSDPVNLQPSPAPGWQIVRLTLVANGSRGKFQIYDLELDPYAKG